MFLWSILLVLSISPLAETCVPTVPPEEYYPTASLPEETTKPMEATTTAEEEEMTTTGGGGATVASTTAGGGGATVASTTAAEEDMCADCDISDVGPTTTGPDVEVATQEETTDDGCKATGLSCSGPAANSCTTVEMRATNPTTSMLISDITGANTVVATLICQKNGRYSYGTFTDITAIECVVTGCTPVTGK